MLVCDCAHDITVSAYDGPFWLQSSVISSAMDSVKQQKLEMMRAIKKLQNTKATLTKAQQAKREEYQTIKAKLEKDMQK